MKALSMLSAWISALILLSIPVRAAESNIRGPLIETVKSSLDLDKALPAAYRVLQAHIPDLKLEMIKAEVEAAGGRELYHSEKTGYCRMLVATSVLAAKSGMGHDLAIDVQFHPQTREVFQLSPVFVANIERPIENPEIQKLYQSGSVLARAIGLPRVRKENAKRPLLKRVELTYKTIGWTSNPIEGYGYTATLEFESKPNGVGEISSYTIHLAAFDVIETAGIDTKISASSPTSTKLLNVPSISDLEEPGLKPAFSVVGGELMKYNNRANKK